MAEYREIGHTLVRPLLTTTETRRCFITGPGIEPEHYWANLSHAHISIEELIAYLEFRECARITGLGIPDALYEKFFGPCANVGSSWVDWV